MGLVALELQRLFYGVQEKGWMGLRELMQQEVSLGIHPDADLAISTILAH